MDRLEAFLEDEHTLDQLDGVILNSATRGPSKGSKETGDLAVREQSDIFNSSGLDKVLAGSPPFRSSSETDVIHDVDEFVGAEDCDEDLSEGHSACKAGAVGNPQGAGGVSRRFVGRPPLRKEATLTSQQSPLPSVEEQVDKVDFTGAVQVHMERAGAPTPAAGRCNANLSRQAALAGRAPQTGLRIAVPRVGVDGICSLDGPKNEMRYLQIGAHDRLMFGQYAKTITAQASAECAVQNPYVQALSAHRRDLTQYAETLNTEEVDSLPSRLATRRSDALATLEVEKQDGSMTLLCTGPQGCAPGRSSDIEFSPGREEWGDQSSSTSTTAGSSWSEAQSAAVAAEVRIQQD